MFEFEDDLVIINSLFEDMIPTVEAATFIYLMTGETDAYTINPVTVREPQKLKDDIQLQIQTDPSSPYSHENLRPIEMFCNVLEELLKLGIEVQSILVMIITFCVNKNPQLRMGRSRGTPTFVSSPN